MLKWSNGLLSPILTNVSKGQMQTLSVCSEEIEADKIDL